MNGVDPLAVESLVFAAPHWFWLLLLAPVMVGLFFYARKKRKHALDLILSRRLQPRLAAGVSESRRVSRFFLTLLGFCLGVTALARPQWGFVWEETKRQGRDVILAIDTSRSMLANDLMPDRLKRAKLAAEDIISQLDGDRVGLIAFAGSAFLQAPLTVDYAAARESLNEFDTEIIPRGGTNLTAAISEAEKAFGKGESEHRALIIFSDGEELEADAVAAAEKQKGHFRIFTVGVGTPNGALIPLKTERGGTDFVRGDDREAVTSRLDEKRLQEVAQAAGGFYVRMDSGQSAMRQIITEGLAKMSTQDIEARMNRQPIERYQWPLGAAVLALLIAVLLGERRLGMPRVAVVLMILMAFPAYAKNDGATRYAEKDYKGAAEQFEKEAKRNPAPELDYNLGCAAYEAGDYDKAAEAFARAMARGNSELQAKSAYNLGNTLAARGEKQEDKKEKLKDWINASEHFESATKLAPNDENASYNLDEARKMIAQLKKEEEQQKQEQKDQKKDDKKDKEQKKDEKEKGEGEDKKEKGQDGEKQEKQEQSDSQGEKSEQAKNEEGKKDESKGEGEKEEKKDKSGDESGEDGKNEDKQGNAGEKQGENGKDGKDEGQQQPEPKQPEKMKEGEVKTANEQSGEPKDPGAEQGKPGESMAQAEKEGMTEQDAKDLFNSMKKLDRRVRLFELNREQEREIRKGQFKDW